MLTDEDLEKIKKIRETCPNMIAAELVKVQPMPSDLMQKLYEVSTDEQTLVKEGYEPVSKFGLMWVKKDVE